MAKAKKASFSEAQELWETFLSHDDTLTGVQKEQAQLIVDSIAEKGDVVFWTGRSTGKTYLLEQLNKCFGG